ncbi:glycosyltransferase [Flavobacterium enshiense]|uniref:glycosyltransferase n=1 Tax=Flavobacterium enshiense TaxID=1341165 RepID=UPI00345C6894
MKLLVISGAPLIPSAEGWKAYSPYVKEMALWAKYADDVQFCCPIWETDRGLLISEVPFDIQAPIRLKEFSMTSFSEVLKSVFAIVVNLVIMIKAMQKADHIHLRCPGNVGLLGCIVQILFPNKPKTAKYAGNWDPKAKQPSSYRIQKWILSNTFLTKNMQVLVYGEWEGSSRNIKPFFTATYHESDKELIQRRLLDKEIKMIFVGTLSEGKRPLYAVQLVEELRKKGHNVKLDMYGEGNEREVLSDYIKKHQLEKVVCLKGNQNSQTIKAVYKESHFVLLPSKSEGWPKVLAEGMFWGCVPIATKVSCVPTMLNEEERGLLLTLDLDQDVNKVSQCIASEADYVLKSEKAMAWSRNYTLDAFEAAIKQLLAFR